MKATKLVPLFALGFGLLLAGSPRAADPVKDPPAKEPTEKDVKAAEAKANVVADLGTAADLVAFGRGQSCEATSAGPLPLPSANCVDGCRLSWATGSCQSLVSLPNEPGCDGHIMRAQPPARSPRRYRERAWDRGEGRGPSLWST